MINSTNRGVHKQQDDASRMTMEGNRIENRGRKTEPRPNLEEPAEVGRVGFPRLLFRRGRGGNGRISASGEGIIAAVDGEVAEEIPDGEERTSDSPHLSETPTLAMRNAGHTWLLSRVLGLKGPACMGLKWALSQLYYTTRFYICSKKLNNFIFYTTRDLTIVVFKYLLSD